MKITISNPNKQVHSAFSTMNNLSLNLYINFRDKWPEFYWMTGDTVELFVYNDEQSFEEITTRDSVLFTPENAQEKALLNCLKFDLPNKDQLWTMFVAESVYDGEANSSTEFI